MSIKKATPPQPALLKPWAARKKLFEPAAISVSKREIVRTFELECGAMLPLVIEPQLRDVNLQSWASSNIDFIESSLLKYGGLLFRGFNIKAQYNFEQFTAAVCSKPMLYMEGATPRTRLSDTTYTSTEFPADQRIALHNELSYVITFPSYIWFFCEKPAEQGGETPIADVRKVFQRIDPEIKERFAQKGWMLVRNFGDGFGLHWKTSFHAPDRASVEEYFRKSRIKFKWRGDDRLQTRQVRPAAMKHPATGEMLWFNHAAFWHVSSLEPELRKSFLKEYGESNLPYNTYYGDGSPIEADIIRQINEAYQQETVTFQWREGDILMLDNMLVAHGRNPFCGPRKILVSMGHPFSRTDF